MRPTVLLPEADGPSMAMIAGNCSEGGPFTCLTLACLLTLSVRMRSELGSTTRLRPAAGGRVLRATSLRRASISEGHSSRHFPPGAGQAQEVPCRCESRAAQDAPGVQPCASAAAFALPAVRPSANTKVSAPAPLLPLHEHPGRVRARGLFRAACSGAARSITTSAGAVGPSSSIIPWRSLRSFGGWENLPPEPNNSLGAQSADV